MNFPSVNRSKSRFSAILSKRGQPVIGQRDLAGPRLRDYCLGLIMPCERKCVEPMAAVTAPDRTAAQHSCCCILSASRLGRTRRYWPRRVRRSCQRLPVTVTDLKRGYHRRYRFSQERRALGRRATPVLRSAREAGELPSGGVAVTRQSPREPAGRLASRSTQRAGVPTTNVGARRESPMR